MVASSGRGRAYHPEVKAGTSRESGLDVAFLSSVCLGHEESGSNTSGSPDSDVPLIGVSGSGNGSRTGRRTGTRLIRPGLKRFLRARVYLPFRIPPRYSMVCDATGLRALPDATGRNVLVGRDSHVE